MGQVIDTSIWIDYFRNIINQQTDAVADIIINEELIMIPVIMQEVLQGIREEALFKIVRNAFLEYQFIRYDNINISIEAASLFRFLSKKGVTIRKPNDCLIAVICIENKLTLLHNDKDFENIAKHTSLKIYK
jgi:predicted nucleic acid-binding protein